MSEDAANSNHIRWLTTALVLLLSTPLAAAEVNLLLECPDSPDIYREALIDAGHAAVSSRSHQCYRELGPSEISLLEPEYALLIIIRPAGEGWQLEPELQNYTDGEIQRLTNPPQFKEFRDLLLAIDFYCGALLDTIEP
ncbi:MAG: hypothetical protein GF399_01860 [Candidatus Coatesbacteria bacterium]|nr:hypothetical protein [Candidatus Coatesbacteria bacterium]